MNQGDLAKAVLACLAVTDSLIGSESNCTMMILVQLSSISHPVWPYLWYTGILQVGLSCCTHLPLGFLSFQSSLCQPAAAHLEQWLVFSTISEGLFPLSQTQSQGTDIFSLHHAEFSKAKLP